MDHDSTGGAVSDGCVNCDHDHCNFDVILSHNFEERYKFADWIIKQYMVATCVYPSHDDAILNPLKASYSLMRLFVCN